MWNRFDKTIIADLLTDDLRFRGSLGEFKSGRNEFGEYVDFIQRTFPDFSGVVEEIISEGDKAFARLTWQGTHCGELLASRQPGGAYNMPALPSSSFAAIGLPRCGYSATFTGLSIS